jgi:hypothetical protein
VGEVGVEVEQVEDAADRVVDQVVDRFGLDVEGRDRGRDDRAGISDQCTSLEARVHG